MKFCGQLDEKHNQKENIHTLVLTDGKTSIPIATDNQQIIADFQKKGRYAIVGIEGELKKTEDDFIFLEPSRVF